MNRLQANLCLLCTTLCWSTEVIIFSIIPEDILPFATTCITSLVGAVLLFFCFSGRIIKALKDDRCALLRRAFLLAAMNATYNLLFMFGLEDFDVSAGAFTLSLTVVAVPLVLFIQRKKVGPRTLISAAMVLIGIISAMAATFHVNQLEGLSLIAIGCVMRADFIVRLNRYAREHDPISMVSLMAAFSGMISFFIWLPLQPATFAAINWTGTTIASLAVYAYFVVGFAQVLNFFAQRRTTPTDATILYSMEIVFSVIWSAFLPPSLIDRVPLTVPVIIGVLFVVAGNIIVIYEPGMLHFGKKKEGAS